MSETTLQALIQKSAGEFLQECSVASSRKNALENESSRLQEGIQEVGETVRTRVTEVNEGKAKCIEHVREREELRKRITDSENCLVGYKSLFDKSQKHLRDTVHHIDSSLAPRIQNSKASLKQQACHHKLIQEVLVLEHKVKAKLLSEAETSYHALSLHCLRLVERNVISTDAIEKGRNAAEADKLLCEKACEDAKHANRTVNLELRTQEMEEAALQQQCTSYATGKDRIKEEHTAAALDVQIQNDQLKSKTVAFEELEAKLAAVQLSVTQQQEATRLMNEEADKLHSDIKYQVSIKEQEGKECASSPSIVGHEKNTNELQQLEKDIKEQVVLAVIHREANVQLKRVQEKLVESRFELEHQCNVLQDEMDGREKQRKESQLRGKEEVRQMLLSLRKKQHAKLHYEEDTARMLVQSEESEARAQVVSLAAKEHATVLAAVNKKSRSRSRKEEEVHRSLSRHKPQKRRHLSVPESASGRVPMKRRFTDMFRENNSQENSARSEASALWYDPKGRERSALKKRPGNSKNIDLFTKLEI